MFESEGGNNLSEVERAGKKVRMNEMIRRDVVDEEE